jgi:hypothetical protein
MSAETALTGTSGDGQEHWLFPSFSRRLHKPRRSAQHLFNREIASVEHLDTAV